jgi:hypothetical protein
VVSVFVISEESELAKKNNPKIVNVKLDKIRDLLFSF